MSKLPIMEIFDSIQGEGSFIGQAVTFVRVAGCNLRCDWCDTKASWAEHWLLMDPKEIAARCSQNIVVITGGEPCLYRDAVNELILLLHEDEIFVCIETNGTLETPSYADFVTCSPKPPEYKIHPKCRFDELKYVVDDTFTIDSIPKYIKDGLIEGLDFPHIPSNIWLQPEGFNMQESAKKAYALVMQYDFLRMGIQLHKIIDVK